MNARAEVAAPILVEARGPGDALRPAGLVDAGGALGKDELASLLLEARAAAADADAL